MGIFPPLDLPGLFVEAIWFVGYDAGDWMAMMYRVPGESWTLTYRFRYDVGESAPFDFKDEKSVFKFVMNDDTSLEEAVAKVDILAAAIAKGRRGTLTKLPIKGDGLKALEEMSKQPWCHTKIVPLPPPSTSTH